MAKAVAKRTRTRKKLAKKWTNKVAKIQIERKGKYEVRVYFAGGPANGHIVPRGDYEMTTLLVAAKAKGWKVAWWEDNGVLHHVTAPV